MIRPVDIALRVLTVAGAALFAVFAVVLFGGMAFAIFVLPFYGFWTPAISAALVALLWFSLWGFISFMEWVL